MAWHEKVGDKYRGRYQDPTGKIHTAVNPETGRTLVSSKRKALQLAGDEEAKIRAGSWIDPSAGAITFSDYFEKKWLPNKVVELNTVVFYEAQYNGGRAYAGLRDEFGDMQLRHIKHSDVQGWVSRMHQAGVTPRTIQARLRALQTVLAAQKGVSAIRDGLIQANPCHGVEIPYVPERDVEIYEPDEVDALLRALDPWWVPLIAVDVDMGVRWGELMGLQVEDFAFGFKSVTVKRTILEPGKKRTGNGTRFTTKEYPKGRKQRTFAISPDVSQLLAAVVAERELGPGDRLFSMPDTTPPADWYPPMSLVWTPLRTDVWPHGLPISRNYFRSNVWKPAIVKAGLPDRRIHDLRATNLSWLLAGTQNVAMVMERAGHVNFDTTRRYMAKLRDADQEAIAALAAVREKYRTPVAPPQPAASAFAGFGAR